MSGAPRAVDIPIIASLNGTPSEGWIAIRDLDQEAGAKGLELNIDYIADGLRIGTVEVEGSHPDISRRGSGRRHHSRCGEPARISVPSAYMARLISGSAGADARFVRNRFYQPDIDLADLDRC